MPQELIIDEDEDSDIDIEVVRLENTFFNLVTIFQTCHPLILIKNKKYMYQIEKIKFASIVHIQAQN